MVIKFELNNNPQVFDLSLLKEMFFNGQGDLFDILVDSLGEIGVKFNNTFSGLKSWFLRSFWYKLTNSTFLLESNFMTIFTK